MYKRYAQLASGNGSALWRSPGPWADPAWASATHSPFTMGFSTSLRACWHLIVQDVPGARGPTVLQSLENWASLPPYPRESSRCGKLVSAHSFLLLLFFFLPSHPNAVSAATTASHIQTPKRDCVLSWSVTTQWGQSRQAVSHQATPVVTSHPLATEHIVASFLNRDLWLWPVLTDPRAPPVPYLSVSGAQHCTTPVWGWGLHP